MDDQKTGRARLLLAAMAALLAAAAGLFAYLWFHPDHRIVGEERQVTAAEALKYYPDCLITRQEFELAADLLADGEVAGLLAGGGEPDGEPGGRSLDAGRFVAPGTLQIEGRPAEEVGITACEQFIEVSYLIVLEERDAVTAGGEEAHPFVFHWQYCRLYISKDGSIAKTSGNGYFADEPDPSYTVHNVDNREFTLYTEKRDLFGPFHKGQDELP